MLKRRLGRTSSEASRRVWRRAIELGVNLIDTARSYREQYADTIYRRVFKAQADSCTESECCTERCPSQLEIPALLKKADMLLTSQPCQGRSEAL